MELKGNPIICLSIKYANPEAKFGERSLGIHRLFPLGAFCVEIFQRRLPEGKIVLCFFVQPGIYYGKAGERCHGGDEGHFLSAILLRLL